MSSFRHSSQVAQHCQGFAFAAQSIFSSRSDATGAAVPASTTTDQLKGAGDQLILNLEQALT
jgi:hypothetical protein